MHLHRLHLLTRTTDDYRALLVLWRRSPRLTPSRNWRDILSRLLFVAIVLGGLQLLR